MYVLFKSGYYFWKKGINEERATSLLIRKALDFRPYMPGAQVTVEKGNRLG